MQNEALSIRSAISQLFDWAVAAGATVEEDERRPGLRCFQVCAPYGRVWRGNDTKHLVVELPLESGAAGDSMRGTEVRYARDSLARGHRMMNAEEARICDEEPVETPKD